MTIQSAARHKRGGVYFEDFTPGEVVEHRFTRTVTQMDNMLFDPGHSLDERILREQFGY